jgi:hypothetical protein
MNLPTDNGIPQFLTLEEAGASMNVSKSTLYRFCKQREKELGIKILTKFGKGKGCIRVTKHSIFAACSEGFPGREELLSVRVSKCETKIEHIERQVGVLADDLAERRAEKNRHGFEK